MRVSKEDCDLTGYTGRFFFKNNMQLCALVLTFEVYRKIDEHFIIEDMPASPVVGHIQFGACLDKHSFYKSSVFSDKEKLNICCLDNHYTLRVTYREILSWSQTINLIWTHNSVLEAWRHTHTTALPMIITWHHTLWRHSIGSVHPMSERSKLRHKQDCQLPDCSHFPCRAQRRWVSYEC